MTSFFSDLEDQLRAAAREHTSGAGAPSPQKPPRPGRRRRWLARGARLAPVGLAVAVAVGVLVGALALLGHRGGQAPGAPATHPAANGMAALMQHTPAPQLHRELALMTAATMKVLTSPACHVPETFRTHQIHATPSRALLSALAVLRRPATGTDRLAADEASPPGPGMSVYAGATRRVARIRGSSYYIVPIRQDPAGGLPSARCFALQEAALAQALPNAPAALRKPTRELQAAFIAYDTGLAAKPPVDGVCIVTVQGHGSGMGCAQTAAEIRQGVLPSDDNGRFSGIAPDGVASVTLSFPAVPGQRAPSVTATVHNNFYAIEPGAFAPFKPGSPSVIWRSADGHVLHTFSEPEPGSLKRLCRQHPEVCIPGVQAAGLRSYAASSSSSSASVTATSQASPSPRPKTGGG
jgi:hypothetical protein